MSNAATVNDVIESENVLEDDQLLQRDSLTRQQRLEIECKKARYQVCTFLAKLMNQKVGLF